MIEYKQNSLFAFSLVSCALMTCVSVGAWRMYDSWQVTAWVWAAGPLVGWYIGAVAAEYDLRAERRWWRRRIAGWVAENLAHGPLSALCVLAMLAAGCEPAECVASATALKSDSGWTGTIVCHGGHVVVDEVAGQAIARCICGPAPEGSR